MGCLDEQTVVAFVNGRLAGDALAAAERHLLGCGTCVALIAVAAPARARGRGPTPVPGAEMQIGRYRLLRRVGRGGMGDVYAAHDPELDRKIAIKILRAGARPDDIEAARLLREAQAVARLSHPNVVTIYDTGTDAGRVFFVMELVEGATLHVWLSEQKRARAQILRVYGMAGRGLAAAHKAGIIHRDFKPQNVMVAADGTARVMDFGLAARGADAHDLPLTMAGSILGTPLYMSPEQLRGERVDARADQFSFCVALYEALYGERPFHGSNVLELRQAVLAGAQRPEPRGARVPRRIRAALRRGLSVDRARRFRDMDALLAALEPPPPVNVRKAAALAGVLALAAAGVTAVVHTGRVRRAAICADVAPKLAGIWEAAPEGPRRRDMRAAFLASSVADARERFERTAQILDAYAGGWAAAFSEGCRAALAAGRAPTAASSPRAVCLERRRAELGALTRALARADDKVVDKAIAAALSLRPLSCTDAELAQAAPRGLHAVELTTRLSGLRAMAETGHAWEALVPLRALTAELRASGAEPLLTEALLVLGRAQAPFDPDAAVPVYEEAFNHAEATRDDDAAAEAAIQLTVILGAISHRFDDGEHWAEIAETKLGHGAERARLRAWFFDARGAMFAARGAWRRADADFTASVAGREQSLGPAHPELAASLVDRGRAALMLGHPAIALDAANRALGIAGAVFPPDAYQVASARLVRGEALFALGQLADARADLEAVRTGFEKNLGRDHPFVAQPMTVLGEIALGERRVPDARALLDRAWEIRSTHVADAGARERTAFSLARAMWQSGRADRAAALELAREAEAGYEALPDLSWRLAEVERWIAQAR